MRVSRSNYKMLVSGDDSVLGCTHPLNIENIRGIIHDSFDMLLDEEVPYSLPNVDDTFFLGSR